MIINYITYFTVAHTILSALISWNCIGAKNHQKQVSEFPKMG